MFLPCRLKNSCDHRKLRPCTSRPVTIIFYDDVKDMSEDVQQTSAEATKREMTPARMEALAKARAKAQEVRARNTELRRKEREIVAKQLESNRLKREAAIHSEHSQMSEGAQPEKEEDIEYVYQTKPKKKKKIIVVEQSDSEEELTVQMPKEKRKDPKYERAYRKMFEL